MENKLRVELGASSYDIVVERGAINRLASFFKAHNKFCIVSDDNIPEQYVNIVKSQFPNSIVVRFPHGEEHKDISSYSLIINEMVANKFTRKDAIIALGGGLTSDVAGFAASSYMRGIDFYIVPTTLLSQVDASIGGKVAINMNGIKNLLGAFHQPRGVVIDIDTLKTLNPRIYNEGIAEIIKMAAIYDKELFEKLENCDDFNANLEDIIYKSLLIKKDVVEKDEKESHLRSILNFGHTVGHAVEAIKPNVYYHGEAVAIGMLYFSFGDAKLRIKNLLERYHLPTKDDYKVDELISFIQADKKAHDNKIKICEVYEIGTYKLVDITFDELKLIMEAHKNEK